MTNSSVSRRTVLKAVGAAGVAGAAGSMTESCGGSDVHAEPKLQGIADLHVHLASHLGFGGRLFAGRPDGGAPGTDALEVTLPDCTGPHGIHGTGLTEDLRWYGLGLLVMGAIEDKGYAGEKGHATNGWPKFDGWPKFTSTIHQQGHIDWIRRAHGAGLRLMVALAVNTKLLAEVCPGDIAPDDATAIERQIAFVKEFAARHGDLMQVVLSPAEAREVIAGKRIAVVLGVEVDQLLDRDSLDELGRGDLAEAMRVRLDRLHDSGVRHVFPIHLANNLFGGCALYRDSVFWANQLHVNQTGFDLTDGTADGVSFRFERDAVLTAAEVLFARGGHIRLPGARDLDDPGSHTNLLGLTDLGRSAIEHLIKRQFIIDVDHMSQRSLRDTLAIVEQHRYPVVSGHSGFRPLGLTEPETASSRKRASETLKTDADIDRIRRVGGMVAPILAQGDVRPAHEADPAIADRGIVECAGSSTSFAQAYLYAVHRMPGQGVGFGSDLNGLGHLPGPRFGPNAAYALHNSAEPDDQRRTLRRAQVERQKVAVQYDSPITDWQRYRWAEGVTLEDDDATKDERGDLWQAVAVLRGDCDVWAGTTPAGQPITGVGGRAMDLARGIRTGLPGGRFVQLPVHRSNPAQRVGFLLGSDREPDSADAPEVRDLHAKLAWTWARAEALASGGGNRITRAHAGERDYDINVDGMAHYGLLPDFIADLKAIGLSDNDLGPLNESAEEYVRVWERCTGARPAATP